MEGDDGTGIGRRADLLDIVQRLALGILLAIGLAFAVNFCREVVGKCIDAAYAHTVQTAGNLIAALAELTAGVQHCEHDLQCGTLLLLVQAHGDTAAVICYPYRIAFQDGHLDVCAEARQSLVDGVVHHLIYQMMKSSCRDIADVHRRSLADRFQTLQDLDTVGRIILRFLIFNSFFLCCHIFKNILAKIRKKPRKTLLFGVLKTQKRAKNLYAGHRLC